MGRRRASVALSAVTAALMVLAACTGDATGPVDDAAVSTGSPVRVDGALDTSDPAQRALWELGGGARPADSPVDRFWSEELGGATLDYRSPTAVIPYLPGEIPGTACGARLPAQDWVGNAYYCDLDSTIAYDVDFIAGLIEVNGEHAGLAVLAHEWGHHVQHLQSSGIYTIQRELEADCLAAYYLGRLELGGGPDALDSTMQAFYRLGDTEFAEATWFAAGEHGSPNQRFAAAATGFFAIAGGMPYCQGFGEWSPGSRVTLGPWSLVEIPGHQGTATPDGPYSVPADALPELTVERVPLTWEPDAPEAAAAAWLATQDVTLSQGPYPQTDGFALVYVERTGLDQEPEREMVGVYGDADDPGHALVIRATFSGQLTEAETEEAYLVPAQLVSLVGTRICRPGEQAESAEDEGYNYLCDPAL